MEPRWPKRVQSSTAQMRVLRVCQERSQVRSKNICRGDRDEIRNRLTDRPTKKLVTNHLLNATSNSEKMIVYANASIVMFSLFLNDQYCNIHNYTLYIFSYFELLFFSKIYSKIFNFELLNFIDYFCYIFSILCLTHSQKVHIHRYFTNI